MELCLTLFVGVCGLKIENRSLRLKMEAFFVNLHCHFLFMDAEKAFILRTIDTSIGAGKANPRLISSNQGKNAMQCNAIAKLKLKIHASKSGNSTFRQR